MDDQTDVTRLAADMASIAGDRAPGRFGCGKLRLRPIPQLSLPGVH